MNIPTFGGTACNGAPGPGQSRYILPQLRGAHGLRLQAPGPVRQAVRGPHHLPRRAGRRRVGRRRHGPAARAREPGPRPRHHHVHQLARWLVHGHDGDLRHDAVHLVRRSRPSCSARRPRPRPCCWRRARPASASRCRTRASSSTSPRWARPATARRPTSRSRRAEIMRMRTWLEETLAKHSNRTQEQVNTRHRPRQDPLGRGGPRVRSHRPGAHHAQARCRRH